MNSTVRDDLEFYGNSWIPQTEEGFRSPLAPSLRKESALLNHVIAGLVTSLLIMIYVFFYEEACHWFILPLLVCGTLSGSYLVAWVRREIDLFDPLAAVGGYFYLNYFLAPLLHIAHDIQSYDIIYPDRAKWMGIVACFNIVGLFCFKIVQRYIFQSVHSVKSYWSFNEFRFFLCWLLFSLVCLSMTIVIKTIFGGLTYTMSESIGTLGKDTSSVSFLLMLADPLIWFIMTGIIYFMLKKEYKIKIISVSVLLFVPFIIQFLLMAQRSSRIGLLMPVVLTAITIHYFLYKLPFKFIGVMLCLVFIFTYLFDFKKKLGDEGWAAFYSASARKSMAYERGGVSPIMSLLEDYSRSNVHAMMIYKILEEPNTFAPQYGKTYGMGMLMFIPRAIWKNKPRNPKIEAGTKIIDYGSDESQRQYGLTGEAMLNFGYYGIAPAFIVFAAVLGFFRKKIATMEPTDARLFLVPILTWGLAFAVNMELENVNFNMLKMGFLPFLFVLLTTIKMPLQHY